ncbi:MFS transporter [Dasania sp. GY-MA-18]|uniref:MFS transporter n=1 Tax=Dasania phycosphaerae TaxID=2950436 RepID=A0A9J6RNQ5_9GAMM|nr:MULTISPECIES: MFS transporter [Dasania]MCR8923698.1 MFS transporter [Dasania sp. GY-MA-18]MCZ0866132.1 MFS transporter [Dasania phycosphaerae]MCZ0869856.1 MFS transporter [Dasania phycosphaerae]
MPHLQVNSAPQFSWRQAFSVYCQRPVIALFFLGFAAGLPFLLVFSTLSAWLNDYGIGKTTIGFFGWVGITYSIKVLWSPIVDQLSIPYLSTKLGQRRSWMLAGQLGIALGLLILALLNPQQHIVLIALAALLVAFSSSTQDIAIDAFRIESARQEFQGAMSASYIFGYRLALLAAGAGSLYLAEFFSWSASYLCMAALMLVGIITSLVVQEPNGSNNQHSPRSEHDSLLQWFKHAVIAPFSDFFQRQGSFALLILGFIAVFRLSDITMGIMANPFYLDLGFSKTDIAEIGKVFGFFMTIAGSFFGGLLVIRYGVHKPLITGAIMVASTNLLFVALANIGPDIYWLMATISADNLSAGLANAAFIAYLSGLTNRAYTATQYALFSSLMTLPGKSLSGFSGVIVDASSYQVFFTYAAVMGIPAILLAVWVMRHDKRVA